MKKLATALLIATIGVRNAASVLVVPAESADPITFNLAMVDPETTPYLQRAAKIAEKVEKATDGRIKIKIEPAEPTEAKGIRYLAMTETSTSQRRQTPS